VTSRGADYKYVKVCLSLFKSEGAHYCHLIAIGEAVGKAVAVAHQVKRHIAGLHSVTRFGVKEVHAVKDKGCVAIESAGRENSGEKS
jgi:hypothetical protein